MSEREREIGREGERDRDGEGRSEGETEIGREGGRERAIRRGD